MEWGCVAFACSGGCGSRISDLIFGSGQGMLILNNEMVLNFFFFLFFLNGSYLNYANGLRFRGEMDPHFNHKRFSLVFEGYSKNIQFQPYLF